MARTSTYLNFQGKTEDGFSDAEQKMVMHIELPITGGHVLMGTDALESMGHKLTVGNNITINLEPDARAEADRLHVS